MRLSKQSLSSTLLPVEAGQRVTLTAYAHATPAPTHRWLVPAARVIASSLVIGPRPMAEPGFAEQSRPARRQVFPYLGVGVALGLPHLRRDDNGKFITSGPYQENGVWKIDMSDYSTGSRVIVSYTIAYHFHTHPGAPYDPNTPSPDDLNLAKGQIGMEHRIINSDNIVTCDQNCATNFTNNYCR